MLFNWVGKFESHPKKCLFRPISKGCSKSNFVLSYFFNQGLGFPDGTVVKNLPANAGDKGSIPGSGRSPERRIWQPTPIFLPGKFHGQRSLAGYSPWGHKELDMTEQLTFNPVHNIPGLDFNS